MAQEQQREELLIRDRVTGQPRPYYVDAKNINLGDDETYKSLPDVLGEMQDDIDDVKEHDGGYTPPQGGIPKTDLAQSVQDTLDDVANKVDKVTGKGLSTNDYTDAEKSKLGNLPTADQLTQQMASKANDNAVVKSITVNGGTAQTPTNGNVNINVQGGGQVTVTTNNDGTFTIHSGDNDYTINLNHTHEGMAKLEKVTEATLPQTFANDTIYVQVDDMTDPQAIEALHIFGLEFVGGGGGVTPGVPGLTYPKISELTLEGDGSADATNTIKVKAQNIAGAINVAISGTGFSITAKDGVALSTPITSANGPLVISNADALLGVMLTIAYNGTDDAEGSLVISSAAATAEFTAKSVDLIADITIALPAGWQANKAWNASVEIMSAPGDQEGYCTTEFFALAHDNSREFGWICKAGYTCDHDGITGDIPRGLMVLKAALTDTNTNAAYRQKTDPIAYGDTDNTTYKYNFISATFKMSKLPNCYIYDTIAGRYLWAGSNVDTSVAPNV